MHTWHLSTTALVNTQLQAVLSLLFQIAAQHQAQCAMHTGPASNFHLHGFLQGFQGFHTPLLLYASTSNDEHRQSSNQSTKPDATLCNLHVQSAERQGQPSDSLHESNKRVVRILLEPNLSTPTTIKPPPLSTAHSAEQQTKLLP
jgi:hypothetical protein